MDGDRGYGDPRCMRAYVSRTRSSRLFANLVRAELLRIPLRRLRVVWLLAPGFGPYEFVHAMTYRVVPHVIEYT